MEPKFIIKYVRDKKRNPIGCVVSTAAGQLGACFLNKVDRKGVSKKEMIELAKARSLDCSHIERNSKITRLVTNFGTVWNIPHCMLSTVDQMLDRSYRYFK